MGSVWAMWLLQELNDGGEPSPGRPFQRGPAALARPEAENFVNPCMVYSLSLSGVKAGHRPESVDVRFQEHWWRKPLGPELCIEGNSPPPCGPQERGKVQKAP